MFLTLTVLALANANILADPFPAMEKSVYHTICSTMWSNEMEEANYVVSDPLIHDFCEYSYPFYLYLGCNSQCKNDTCPSRDLMDSSCFNPKECVNGCVLKYELYNFGE